MIETPQSRYEAKYIKKITFKFNIKTDADILAWLESQENKQGAIKSLIRAEIKREKAD